MTQHRITRVPLPPLSVDPDLATWMRTVAEALNSILINYNEDGNVVIDGEVMDGGVVSSNGSQTLTNKTLVAPIVSDASINGAIISNLTLDTPLSPAFGGTGLSTLSADVFLKVNSDGTGFELAPSSSLYKQSMITITGGAQNHNVLIDDDATFVIVSSHNGSAATITGIANGTPGRRVAFRGNANQNAAIYIVEENSGSATTNRIQISSGAQVILQSTIDNITEFIYDGHQQRWVLVNA